MTFVAILLAVLYALGLWWFSTGAILWLDRRTTSYRLTLVAATVVALGVSAALWITRSADTPAGAFTAFTAALLLWGWHELSFLTGAITGPSRTACPPGVVGWRRFRLATATLIHHELALAATAVAVAVVTLGQANPIAGWTFLVLFVARLSSKLNLFLGVPNFSAEFFPQHLRHLTSYLRKGPVSPLFPLSLLGLTAIATAAARLALPPAASAFQTTGFALVFALTALALLEHGFMALPVADTALWRWALPAAERARLRVATSPDPIKTSNGSAPSERPQETTRGTTKPSSRPSSTASARRAATASSPIWSARPAASPTPPATTAAGCRT
ncbi:putative photosynthetic complex assembly protein PuhE [soil metagenome]